MPWAQEEQPLQAHLDRLRRVRGEFDLGQDFTYAIFDRDERRVLGSTGLHTRLGTSAREIGYWIHVAHTGQGYATETSAALAKVAFEIERLDRVEIHCDPANAASAAVPRKLGFTLEATLRRRNRWSEEKVTDSMIWSLFADQYPNSPAARLEIQAFDALGRAIPF